MKDRGEISILRREVGLQEPRGWMGTVLVTDVGGCDKAEGHTGGASLECHSRELRILSAGDGMLLRVLSSQ